MPFVLKDTFNWNSSNFSFFRCKNIDANRHMFVTDYNLSLFINLLFVTNQFGIIKYSDLDELFSFEMAKSTSNNQNEIKYK